MTKNCSRRSLLKGTAGMIGLGAAQTAESGGAPSTAVASSSGPKRARARELMRITKLETFLVKPRWLFLKIHTNAGISGWGEPIFGRARPDLRHRPSRNWRLT